MRANRNLLLAAEAIRDRLLTIRDRSESFAGVTAYADDVGRLASRLDRARQRGWNRAAHRLRGRLRNVLAAHRSRVDEAHRALEVQPPLVPSLSTLYADLLALADDFPGANFDRRARRLVVRTEPIELEGVHLGRFDVALRLAEWEHPSPYDVVAVTPNAAATSSDVTHPHVDGETLCEGEGRHAIRHALDGGRVHDFFVIVDRILHTYNPESAYVPLGDRDGVACADCGAVVDEDERYDCRRCRCDLCPDCSPQCDGCGDTHCFDCLDRCHVCDERFCPHCARRCQDCGEDHCEEHLDDDQRCPNCRDRLEEDETAPPEAATAEVAADTPCDGEVAVPA